MKRKKSVRRHNHNPHVGRGLAHRPAGKDPYYTANANIKVSVGVKQGLVEIAELEGRSLSWVVAEVFKFYFGLKDRTPYQGLQAQRKITKLRLLKRA